MTSQLKPKPSTKKLTTPKATARLNVMMIVGRDMPCPTISILNRELAPC